MLQEVRVPDIGDFKNVPIIQILVAVGDSIKAEDPLVVLESDKATIEVPAPSAGVVRELKAAVGDRISQGALLLSLEAGESSATATATSAPDQPAAATPPTPAAAPQEALPTSACARRDAELTTPAARATTGRDVETTPGALAMSSAVVTGAEAGKVVDFGAAAAGAGSRVHAGPSVRALARRLGVDLTGVKGTGSKQRITSEDVHAHVKAALVAAKSAGAATSRGPDKPPAPRPDFAKYGPVERHTLSRIQKISGARLADNWARIPHVTNFDAADITELEAFRVQLNSERGSKSARLSVLPFLIKACAHVLKKHRRVNSSLDEGELVFKDYFHIGFAADTPDGLLVPVIRDVDKKGIPEIAAEAVELAARARERALKLADMEGGCFTVSSLGGIGGSGFTPIINAPEAAILGVGRAAMQPVWDGEKFLPRLILPMALSWDHRIIDGALAARFLADLSTLLRDLRRALL